jgi:hypothetical protein
MPVARLAELLRSWAAALAASAALVAAGNRWPDPLAIRPGLVWGLVLLPPGLMALLLLRRWQLQQPAAGEGGESGV